MKIIKSYYRVYKMAKYIDEVYHDANKYSFDILSGHIELSLTPEYIKKIREQNIDLLNVFLELDYPIQKINGIKIYIQDFISRFKYEIKERDI